MAQDWRVHALVYFYSAGNNLPWAVLYRRLDLELTDMTKDEALKLALEALEHAAEKVYCQNNDDNIALAIAAIKEALAQPVQDWKTLPKEDPPLVKWAKEQPSPLPVQPEERNFCPRCGKRTADLTTIHTCTPPQKNT
jgi:hypothetical protein